MDIVLTNMTEHQKQLYHLLNSEHKLPEYKRHANEPLNGQCVASGNLYEESVAKRRHQRPPPQMYVTSLLTQSEIVTISLNLTVFHIFV